MPSSSRWSSLASGFATLVQRVLCSSFRWPACARLLSRLPSCAGGRRKFAASWPETSGSAENGVEIGSDVESDVEIENGVVNACRPQWRASSSRWLKPERSVSACRKPQRPSSSQLAHKSLVG